MFKGIKWVSALALCIFTLSIGVSLLMGATAYPIPNDVVESTSTTTWDTTEPWTWAWETSTWYTVLPPGPAPVDYTLIIILIVLLLSLFFAWFMLF